MSKGKKQPKHIHFREGARVVVKLTDGRRVIDHFIKLGISSNTVELKVLGRVKLSDILTISRFSNIKEYAYKTTNIIRPPRSDLLE